METENVIDAVKTKSLVQLPNHAGETNIQANVPSKERPMVLQIESELNDFFQAFYDALSVMERAKGERPAVDTAIRNERRILTAKLDEEREIASVNERMSLPSELKDASHDLQCSKRDHECLAMRTTMQADKLKLVAERDKLKRKTDVPLLSLTTEKDRLRNELDASRMKMQGSKRKLDIKLAIAFTEKRKVKRKLLLVERERDVVNLALAHEKSQKIKLENDVIARREEAAEDKRILEQAQAVGLEKVQSDFEKMRNGLLQMVAQIAGKGEKVENELSAVRKENDRLGTVHNGLQRKLEKAVENQRKMELENEELEARSTRYRLLWLSDAGRKGELRKELATMREEMNRRETAHITKIEQGKSYRRMWLLDAGRKGELQNELATMREEKNHLETAHEALKKNLQEEQEKSLCGICLEAPKDTICLPCVHFEYCFLCLDKHRKRKKTCPSCRTSLTGVLRSDISK